MEAWDIIVVGDGPAALRAASAAAKQGASTLMVAVNALGQHVKAAGREGLAASDPGVKQPRSPRRHNPQRCVSFPTKTSSHSRTADAVRTLDLLERWGVNFRRDSIRPPSCFERPSAMQSHVWQTLATQPAREVQKTLEEQCMRHGVVRRGDHLPLGLIHSNQTVHGLTVADMINGRILSIQAKAVILADEGFEGVFSHGAIGIGMDLALRAGLPLRNMEFFDHSPLGVVDTHMVLPTGLMNAGATLHEANGSELDLGNGSVAEVCAAVQASSQAVLDARHLGDATAWWASAFRLVAQRTGIDLSRQTVAVESRPVLSIGGITVDEHGRAINGAWSRWFTGLYAAGGAACTGFHGAQTLSRQPTPRCSWCEALQQVNMQVLGFNRAALEAPQLLWSEEANAQADFTALNAHKRWPSGPCRSRGNQTQGCSKQCTHRSKRCTIPRQQH